jgi:hypothetical protein
MLRWLKRIAIALLVAVAVVYATDWLTFSVRGEPVSKVNVSHFMSAPLKNNKQELDYLGSEDTICSISLFPHAGHDPCWYLTRHKNQVTTL